MQSRTNVRSFWEPHSFYENVSFNKSSLSALTKLLGVHMGRDSKKSLKVSRIATNPEIQHSRPCTHAGIVTGERVEAIAYQIRLFLPVGLVSEMRMGNGTELGGKSGMCVERE